MPAMEFKDKGPTAPDTKPQESTRPAARRGAHWRKFEYRRGLGLKVWQVMHSSGKNPAS
jgi:hypothetical protein